jgi:hypothetical protein
MNGIVKDSSVWVDTSTTRDNRGRSAFVRIGIVKKIYQDTVDGDIRYLVEIQDTNDKIPISCRILSRFGGVYNYEDMVARGYSTTGAPDPIQNYDAKAGDIVLIAFINGEGREGVILGGMTHAARKVSLDPTDGPQYKTEFNGVETLINKDGEITVTFKGQPTNLSMLNSTPSKRISEPKYNTTVGTSYYKFDKTGSYTVSDNSNSGVQSIKIDKPAGTLTISSGNISLKMTKGSEAVNLISKTLNGDVTDKISMQTKEYLISSSSRAFINSPKVAIGKEGIELLDQLFQLIDALGKVQPISPMGPCTPLVTAPNWAGVEAVQGKIKEITGSF